MLQQKYKVKSLISIVFYLLPLILTSCNEDENSTFCHCTTKSRQLWTHTYEDGLWEVRDSMIGKTELTAYAYDCGANTCDDYYEEQDGDVWTYISYGYACRCREYDGQSVEDCCYKGDLDDAPVVYISSPKSGQRFRNDEPVNIRFEVQNTDLNDEIKKIKFDLNGEIRNVTPVNAFGYTLTWIPNVQDAKVPIYLSAEDKQGNRGEVSIDLIFGNYFEDNPDPVWDITLEKPDTKEEWNFKPGQYVSIRAIIDVEYSGTLPMWGAWYLIDGEIIGKLGSWAGMHSALHTFADDFKEGDHSLSIGIYEWKWEYEQNSGQNIQVPTNELYKKTYFFKYKENKANITNLEGINNIQITGIEDCNNYQVGNGAGDFDVSSASPAIISFKVNKDDNDASVSGIKCEIWQGDELIKELDYENKSGEYSASWDGTDHTGVLVEPEVYTVQSKLNLNKSGKNFVCPALSTPTITIIKTVSPNVTVNSLDRLVHFTVDVPMSVTSAGFSLANGDDVIPEVDNLLSSTCNYKVYDSENDILSDDEISSLTSDYDESERLLIFKDATNKRKFHIYTTFHQLGLLTASIKFDGKISTLQHELTENTYMSNFINYVDDFIETDFTTGGITAVAMARDLKRDVIFLNHVKLLTVAIYKMAEPDIALTINAFTGTLMGFFDGFIQGFTDDIKAVDETLTGVAELSAWLLYSHNKSKQIKDFVKLAMELGLDGFKELVADAIDCAKLSLVIEAEANIVWEYDDKSEDIFIRNYYYSWVGGYLTEQVAIICLTTGASAGLKAFVKSMQTSKLLVVAKVGSVLTEVGDAIKKIQKVRHVLMFHLTRPIQKVKNQSYLAIKGYLRKVDEIIFDICNKGPAGSGKVTAQILQGADVGSREWADLCQEIAEAIYRHGDDFNVAEEILVDRIATLELKLSNDGFNGLTDKARLGYAKFKSISLDDDFAAIASKIGVPDDDKKLFFGDVQLFFTGQDGKFKRDAFNNTMEAFADVAVKPGVKYSVPVKDLTDIAPCSYRYLSKYFDDGVTINNFTEDILNTGMIDFSYTGANNPQFFNHIPKGRIEDRKLLQILPEWNDMRIIVEIDNSILPDNAAIFSYSRRDKVVSPAQLEISPRVFTNDASMGPGTGGGTQWEIDQNVINKVPIRRYSIDNGNTWIEVN